MNKFIQLSYGILSLVLLTVIAFPKIESSLGSGSFFINVSRSATATTTTSILAPNGFIFADSDSSSRTGSTTFIYSIDRSASYDLNWMFTASSVDSNLVWSYAFSNNYNEATGNGDWFFEDGNNVDSTTLVTHGATIVLHSYIPTAITASSSETCGAMCFTRNIDVPDMRARHVKLYFGSRVATGTLWHELARELPNSR